MKSVQTKRLLKAFVFFALLILAGCSTIPDTNNSLFGNYDQATMLNNIGNNILMGHINEVVSKFEEADEAINAFTANPNDSTLIKAQSAFNTMVESWAFVSPFNFGPMNDNLILVNIDTWPISATKIENAISAQSNAATVGADTKGLKTLEYLLFDKNGNTAVLSKYTEASSDNRKAFLNSVAQNLSLQITDLQNHWNDGHLNSFVTSKGNDVSSSVSQLVNAVALTMDQIKNVKVGNPIGLGVKVNDNQPHPDKIEYTLTEESLGVMKANIQAMKDAFNGGSAQGFDDLLDYVKAKKNGLDLSDVINDQFDLVITKINAINPPYSNAVSAQTNDVREVFDSLKTLIVYFKVDVANNLGVTITFSDTDGD
ncbi:MAG: imelysin family protein [Bacteroidetes bacterium]|nr:imelysin family protein [Bacteroidota bacterium]